MLLSVVLPVFNRQELAERALHSVLVQDVADMEVVVVDDGSEPPFRLPAELASHPQIRVVRQQNAGESGARNAGIDAARGEWIAFLDSDDYWLPGTLKPRLAAAQQNFADERDSMVVYAAGFVVDNKRTGRRNARIPRESGDVVDFASGCWFCQGSTALFRKETFLRVGPCDRKLRRLQDLDWFLRLAMAGGRVRVWPHIVAVIETGPKASISVLEETARHLHSKYAGHDSVNRLTPSLMRRMDAYLDVERTSIFAASRDWGKAYYYFARSLWLVPRMMIHLERFWRYVELPQSLDPPAYRLEITHARENRV